MLSIEERGVNRLLFENGVTIVDEWDKAKEILSGSVLKTKCFTGYETDRYREMYLKNLSVDVDNMSEVVYDDHLHTDEELNQLIELIHVSTRFNDDEIYFSRIEEEMQYFIDTNNVRFLLKTYELIEKLKRDTVVGVGRGSSCASLVMYLLGIHDIDPIKYKIQFKELSKEISDEQ